MAGSRTLRGCRHAAHALPTDRRGDKVAELGHEIVGVTGRHGRLEPFQLGEEPGSDLISSSTMYPVIMERRSLPHDVGVDEYHLTGSRRHRSLHGSMIPRIRSLPSPA